MRTILAFFFLFFAQGVMALSPDEWHSDIRELVALIKTNHPDPFTRISEPEFDQRVARLLADVAEQSDKQVVASMMALAASLRDGHTTLHPTDPAGFNHWLPLSFYRFEDGVATVAAHSDYASLIGKKVASIGNTDIDVVANRAASLMGSDNDSGNRENIFYLGSLDALHALGFTNSIESVDLRVLDDNGAPATVTVRSVNTPFVLDETRFWGEMYGPLDQSILRNFELPFENMNLVEYSRRSSDEKTNLPLHVRDRQAYWSTYLEDEATFYMQINHTTEEGRGSYDSFRDFYVQAFAFVGANPVDKVILDLRYNSGGDGSILYPFIHEFIRSDKANRQGHLYTIVGRKTYSAATMLLDLMIKQTNTILVGEPAGSALNSYGDPRTFRLTNSGMTLDVSSEYWKLVHTSESPPLTPIDLPAVFAIDDYFSGRDPAVDTILSIEGPYRNLGETLQEEGGAAALERFEREKARSGGYGWWRPFDESAFRRVTRDLVSQGRVEDGLTGFQILVDAYPDSWRAWRDFGKAQLSIGKESDGRNALQRARALNPGDSEINRLLESL